MKNNMLYKPTISVIIPVYNGASRLESCLSSICSQTYPREKLEIIIVDDDSTDETKEIADKFGCIVVRNGSHNPERGKSIGINYATGEYLFFIDDDNIIPHRLWLEKLVDAVINENCVGGQVAKFAYNKKASLPDRYMALMGTGDPAIFYLHRRDHMMKYETRWKLGGKVLKETQDYYKIQFDKHSLPTIGSQGFIIQKQYVKMIKWEPYFYHIDANYELIKLGYDNYIILKDEVVHNHSKSYREFVNKIKRNSKQLGEANQYRTYSYNLSMVRMIALGLTLGTFVVPCYDSIKGFFYEHDWAWFIHPFLSFRIALLYASAVIFKSNDMKKIT